MLIVCQEPVLDIQPALSILQQQDDEHVIEAEDSEATHKTPAAVICTLVIDADTSSVSAHEPSRTANEQSTIDKPHPRDVDAWRRLAQEKAQHRADHDELADVLKAHHAKMRQQMQGSSHLLYCLKNPIS